MAKNPNLNGWGQITYNIFDVPKAQGGLLQRLEVIKNWIDANQELKNRIKIIPQITIKDQKTLAKMFKEIVKSGGEGVVVRDPKAPYTRGISNKNLKYKSRSDAECEVSAHNPAKIEGLINSIECKLPNGKLFKIVAGLGENLPKVGSIITYTYDKIGKTGLPESPVYLRVRND